MKLVRCTAVLLLAIASPALFAQGADVAVWASWAQFGSQDFADPDFDAELEFESSIGYGASANWFWGDHFSTELLVVALESEVELSVSAPGDPDPGELEVGSFNLTPIMLTAQYHFSPDSTFDPYLGVGGAWAITSDIESLDPAVGQTEIDDDFTYLVNVGLGIAFTPTFGLNLDARYIALEPAAFDSEGEFDLELNPLLFSVGLRWRFGS